MADEKDRDNPLGLTGMLGLGLDGTEKPIRITKGENFVLFGGSPRTHQKMQETAVRFNQRVSERQKKLEEINRRELDEIVQEVREDISD